MFILSYYSFLLNYSPLKALYVFQDYLFNTHQVLIQNSLQFNFLASLVKSLFQPRPGHTKGHPKNGTNCLLACKACVRVGV